jgi:hypothetical protein
MAKVNAELYEFLREQAMETGMYYDEKRKELIAYVHVYFFNLEDLVNALGGSYYFDEGGREVTMFKDTICIELQDIFESQGNCILDYKKCFSEDNLKNYEEYLKAEADK